MATVDMKRTKITNPFYERVQREGIHIIGDVGRRAGRTRVTNPYFRRSRTGSSTDRVRIHRTPGRPLRGFGVASTTTKSIRLPPAVWEKIDAQAAREGKNRHAALREAVLIWLQS